MITDSSICLGYNELRVEIIEAMFFQVIIYPYPFSFDNIQVKSIAGFNERLRCNFQYLLLYYLCTVSLKLHLIDLILRTGLYRIDCSCFFILYYCITLYCCLEITTVFHGALQYFLIIAKVHITQQYRWFTHLILEPSSWGIPFFRIAGKIISP